MGFWQGLVFGEFPETRLAFRRNCHLLDSESAALLTAADSSEIHVEHCETLPLGWLPFGKIRELPAAGNAIGCGVACTNGQIPEGYRWSVGRAADPIR